MPWRIETERLGSPSVWIGELRPSPDRWKKTPLYWKGISRGGPQKLADN